ncbi:MAG TPA: Ig-like domain-containing protein, partial [Myxococcaceae bacterium]|nr:Ig-like domain-containing protein [Myxococcaceae bacterium]
DQPGLLELQGCPDPDPDRDRVLGEADACPNEAGPVETRGCPDTDPDRDRVLGEADACPNEAGPIGNRGCPDDPDPDRDGVFGAQDACPKVAGPVENKGCPDKDTDRDGLVDRLDPCPTVAGPADNNGCPDTDSDGDSLVDRLDACPTAAGPAANRGCPEKAAEPPKAGEVTMRDNKIVFKGTVHFATNRDVIQSKSFSLLDSIADFIKAHPEMKKVIVEGHTDNVGGDAHNLALSQRRAQAIVRYLVNKGVAPNLLEAQGFGATKPVADNKTDKGRAQNRRVEFTVTFDALTVTAVTEAGRGAVTFDSVAGTITYVPATGFVGGDSFTYTVDDAHGGTATGRVNVTVVNRAPVAREDAVSGHAPSIVINVLGNDVDEDLDTLTAAAGAPPAHGRVTVNANGTILYEPNAGFTGTDSFTYTVRDSRGATATGRVMVTVLNSAPVAANDTLTGRAPRLGTNVLANDSDVDGDALTVTAVTQPARGSVTFRPDGTVTYAPGPGFTGTDSFTYTVSDRPGSSSTGTVTVNVLAGTDSDGDCLTDDEEIAAGTNPSDADSDDDGVTECREPRWNVDVDGDGLINALDPDSDNDGLFDGTELGVTSADTATDVRKGNFVPDADASTVTNPLDRDTDRGSVSDGAEDSNHNGRIDPGERDPNNPADDRRRGDPFTNDSDGDGLPDTEERTHGTDPYDADSEDDGIIDGAEENWTADTDGDGLINALDPDSDSDGLFDGTEAGVVVPGPATHLAAGHFIADADPSTTTRPLLPDTDSGSVRDGDEDANHDGKVDSGERDPNVKADDVTLLPPPPEGYGVTGGGGCSTAGGAGGLSAILLLALSALRFRRRAR